MYKHIKCIYVVYTTSYFMSKYQKVPTEERLKYLHIQTFVLNFPHIYENHVIELIFSNFEFIDIRLKIYFVRI